MLLIKLYELIRKSLIFAFHTLPIPQPQRCNVFLLWLCETVHDEHRFYGIRSSIFPVFRLDFSNSCSATTRSDDFSKPKTCSTFFTSQEELELKTRFLLKESNSKVNWKLNLRGSSLNIVSGIFCRYGICRCDHFFVLTNCRYGSPTAHRNFSLGQPYVYCQSTSFCCPCAQKGCFLDALAKSAVATIGRSKNTSLRQKWKFSVAIAAKAGIF